MLCKTSTVARTTRWLSARIQVCSDYCSITLLHTQLLDLPCSLPCSLPPAHTDCVAYSCYWRSLDLHLILAEGLVTDSHHNWVGLLWIPLWRLPVTNGKCGQACKQSTSTPDLLSWSSCSLSNRQTLADIGYFHAWNWVQTSQYFIGNKKGLALEFVLDRVVASWIRTSYTLPIILL